MIMGTTRCHVFSRHPPKNMITGNNWTLFNASTVNALLKDLRGEGKMTNLRSVPTSVHHTECGFKNIHDTTQKDRQKAKRKRMKRIQPAGGWGTSSLALASSSLHLCTENKPSFNWKCHKVYLYVTCRVTYCI